MSSFGPEIAATWSITRCAIDPRMFSASARARSNWDYDMGLCCRNSEPVRFVALSWLAAISNGAILTELSFCGRYGGTPSMGSATPIWKKCLISAALMSTTQRFIDGFSACARDGEVAALALEAVGNFALLAARSDLHQGQREVGLSLPGRRQGPRK